MDIDLENLRDLEALVVTLKGVRDIHESTLVFVGRIRREYYLRMEEAKRQLRKRMDEWEGVEPDAALADGTPEERKAELERRIRVVRAQQMSLQDAAVSAYVGRAPSFRTMYAQASRLLERELDVQIGNLNRWESESLSLELRSLKRQEVSQASHYFHYVQELYLYLCGREDRLEKFATYWRDQVQRMGSDASNVRARIRRAMVGPVGH